MTRRWVAALAAVLIMGLCVGAGQARAAVDAHGSVQQVYAVGLKAHARVALVNRSRRVIATQKADALGGIVFRQVSPGPGYRLRTGGSALGRGDGHARPLGAAEHEGL